VRGKTSEKTENSYRYIRRRRGNEESKMNDRRGRKVPIPLGVGICEEVYMGGGGIFREGGEGALDVKLSLDGGEGRGFIGGGERFFFLLFLGDL